VVAFNKLSSSPDGTMHDVAFVDTHDIHPVEERANQTAVQDGENPGSASVSGSDDLILTTPRALPHNSAARIFRAIWKPLIALMTAQYAVMTALTVVAALIVASEAGKAINAKFEPIIAALKRL
jgi:hypothetical protein